MSILKPIYRVELRKARKANLYIIHINPIIWENFDELKTTNTDRYFDHPSYYFLSLFIPIYDDFTYLKDVIALKHEYLITYTPYNLFALKEFEKANLKKID